MVKKYTAHFQKHVNRKPKVKLSYNFVQSNFVQNLANTFLQLRPHMEEKIENVSGIIYHHNPRVNQHNPRVGELLV